MKSYTTKDFNRLSNGRVVFTELIKDDKDIPSPGEEVQLNNVRCLVIGSERTRRLDKSLPTDYVSILLKEKV